MMLVAPTAGGSALWHDGDTARARVIRESVPTDVELEGHSGTADILECLASPAAAEGEPRHALRLAGITDALRESTGGARAPASSAAFKRWLALGRQALDQAEAAAASALRDEA